MLYNNNEKSPQISWFHGQKPDYDMMTKVWVACLFNKMEANNKLQGTRVSFQ